MRATLGATLSVAHFCEVPPLAAGCSRLYLCRHGETDSNAQSLLQGSGVDARLNEVGRAQAAGLAERLASTRLDHVASSTLSRAVETADIVVGQQPASPQRTQHEGLAEMYYGSMEGLPIADCRPQLKALSDAWAAGDTSVAVGGDGESPEALLARATTTLWGDGSLLGSRDAGRHVAVVAHSTFNKAVLSAALGRSLGELFGIAQDNACVNVLDVNVAEGTVEVRALNLVQ